MSVLSVNGPLAGSRELNVTVDGVKSATSVYKVITDGVMSLPAILADPTVAASGIGDTYPLNPDMYIAHVGIRDMSDNVIAYDLTLDYTNERELDPNPLSEPARISVSGEYYQVPVFRDRYGKALVTKSGEYPEGLFEDAIQINFTISKNVPSVPAWLLTAAGAVNISAFSIRGIAIAAEKARLGAVSVSDELTRNGFLFYKVSIPISYRAKGWKTEFMNRGYYHRLTPTGELVQVFDDNGNLPSQPWPLDINGKKIDNPTIDNIVILEYDTKVAFDFNTLPLS